MGQPPAGGAPVTIDAVVALLRDDKMRGFRIEVETDSLVEADQDAEKQRRIEFVTAVSTFMEKMGPVVQSMPQTAPLVGGLLQFVVRGFKVGQELEETIDKTMAAVSDALSQPRPPQPDPTEQIKLQIAQIKMQAETAKSQANIQATGMKAQAEGQKAQIGAQVAQQDGQAKVQAAQMDMQSKAMDHHHAQADHGMKSQQMAAEATQAQQAHELAVRQLMMEAHRAEREHAMKLEQIDAAAKAAKAKPKASNE